MRLPEDKRKVTMTAQGPWLKASKWPRQLRTVIRRAPFYKYTAIYTETLYSEGLYDTHDFRVVAVICGPSPTVL